MRDSSLPHLLIEMTQAAEAIHVILKEIRIDRANPQTKSTRIFLHRLPVIFLVPGNMDGDAGTDAGNSLHLSCIIQLFTQRCGRSRPVKYLEARARITITQI